MMNLLRPLSPHLRGRVFSLLIFFCVLCLSSVFLQLFGINCDILLVRRILVHLILSRLGCYSNGFIITMVFGVLMMDAQPAIPPADEGGLDLNEPAPLPSDAELLEASEANAAECKKLVDNILQRAEEIARASGVEDEARLSNIRDSVQFLCDVDDIDEEARISHLTRFRNDLEQNETWVKIDQECKRWGGRGIC